MRFLGIDFTSAPTRRKPITCTTCRLDADRLIVETHERLPDLVGFEGVLARPGPWVAGLDFPFCFARGFLEGIGWPADWPGLARHLAAMEKRDYLAAVEAFRNARPAGQKHLARGLDRRTGGAAPNNIVNPPVGRMLFEGVPRLAAAGLCLPGLADGDDTRIAVEAYPAVAAKRLIGTTAYKDGPPDDRARRRALRLRLLALLAQGTGFGLSVVAPADLAEDPGGDDLDALLCAVQAAWAHRAGLTGPGGPEGRFDPVEGWIADPDAFAPQETDPMTEPTEPTDAAARRAMRPVICYPTETLPQPDMALHARLWDGMQPTGTVVVPPREARCFRVPAGHVFRIVSVAGPQVGDLNLWNAQDLTERFYSGKTRALHGTHLTTGARMWSSFPYLRPMATITADTLGWYGIDPYGGSVHDVIGTRCDPYTNRLLSGGDYHHCCHSNLTRALAAELGIPAVEAEPHIHDVLNVFMCTGFTRDTGQYFMKASPVRPGDHLEFFAEIDLLGALSACPGGDCSAEHSSDTAACHPLKVEIYRPDPAALKDWQPPDRNAYDRSHGS
jgi:uncharacterized protein YcgI (DUF1989 family)